MPAARRREAPSSAPSILNRLAARPGRLGNSRVRAVAVGHSPGAGLEVWASESGFERPGDSLVRAASLRRGRKPPIRHSSTLLQGESSLNHQRISTKMLRGI
jgi:hypothetical protein